MIWGDIARDPQTHRFETLSAELALCGFNQTYEPWNLGENSIESQWAEIQKKGFAQLRIGRDEGMDVHSVAPQTPRLVSLLKCADALVSENGRWVARSFFYDAIVEIMAQDVTNVDFTGGVLIVGADCEARVLAFALSQVGFTKMLIAGNDEDQADRLLVDLRRACFGVEFTKVRTSVLTQLAATQSVAVNTLSAKTGEALVAELSYFNFLKPNGIWIETSGEAVASPLVQEARELEFQTVSALEVMVHVDAQWALTCFGVTIDRARYLKVWSEKLG